MHALHTDKLLTENRFMQILECEKDLTCFSAQLTSILLKITAKHLWEKSVKLCWATFGQMQGHFFLADLSSWWKVKVPPVSLFNHSTHSLRQQRCLSVMFTSHDESLHRVWESCDYLITSSWQDGHFNTSHDLLCFYLNLISNDFYTISYGHIKCWGK